jgi:ribosome biogenesis GTP-binding protein YsxC/EngB
MSDLEMPINWFPGHMAKSRRLLQDQLKKVDLVIELCDARLPYSSRNPELNRMIGSKRRILLLNKADLADPAVTKRWVEYFRAAGIDAYQNDATKAKSRDTLDAIQRATRETAEKALSKGVRKTIRAMVVGVPNVGKSTLINRLCRRNKLARTSATPGKTRLLNVFLLNDEFHLVDLPGYGFAKVEKQEKQRWGKMMQDYFAKADELRHVLCLVDIRHEPTEDDKQMNRFLRETEIPFTVIATKADKISRGARSKYLAPICRALSVQPWEIICFSGEDGTGRDDLLRLLDGILHPAEA